MRPAAWILVPPLAVVAVALAVANRQPVTLSFDPLPWAVELPLYAVLFGGVLIGLVCGLVAEWWIARRWRREARERRREARSLAEQNARLQAQPSASPTALRPPG